MTKEKIAIKNKIFLSISWYIGLIAFLGGWTIFLVWAGGRYIGACDFRNFEIIGFFWMVAFFWLSLLALALLIVYVCMNRKYLHIKMLLTALIILINIPSVFIILSLQRDIENKVFIKLLNQTGIDNASFKLYGNLKTWNIGSITNGASKVFQYDPPYWNNDSRIYQKPDTLNLIIMHDGMNDTIGFPTVGMGECKQVLVDSNFKIQSP